MSFTRNYPTPFNRDAFQSRLDELNIAAIWRETSLEVPDDAAMATVDAELAAHNANTLTDEQQQESFVDAMRPIIQDWHKGIQTTAQALVSANAVLDAHPTHKTVMNTVRWQNARLIVNPVASVTLGNILGNPNAEAAYLNELFIYVTQVKVWRN